MCCTWDLPEYITGADLIEIYEICDHAILQDLGMFSEFFQQAIFMNNFWINLVLKWWKKAKGERKQRMKEEKVLAVV